jgi:glycosyl transferase family 2
VIRVRALVAIGGLGHETVTEDMLTTFKMEEHGYRTIFLNEALSMGLAPEGLKEYVSQRSRWCLGAIQQIYTRWSFAGRARIGLVSRLSLLDGVLYWVSSFLFKLIMVTAPLLYWWTGASVIVGTAADLIYWLAPSVVASGLFMWYYAQKRVIPIITDVTQLVTALAVVSTVAIALVKPFGHPFKVTAKGLSSDSVTVQWNLFFPFTLAALGTFAGMIANASASSPMFGSPGYGVNMFWSIFNVVVLLLSAAVCVELPKLGHDSFPSGERASIVLPDGSTGAFTLKDISLCGATLTPCSETRPQIASSGTLCMDAGVLAARFTDVRRDGARLKVRFEEDKTVRRALIAKLYTGDYRNDVTRASVSGIAVALLRKLAC